ncbi:MAG: thioredoxin family protein [bacterium]
MSDLVTINPGDQTYTGHEWAIVLFESPWCGSCKELQRFMEKLALPAGIDCFLGRVDITRNQPLAVQYGVMSLPTVVILQKGVLKEKFSGGMSEEKFLQKIKKYIE